MNQGPPGREEIARIAIGLAGLARNKNKELRDLVDEACCLILFCEERAHIAFSNYSRQKENEARSRIFKPADAARSVTGLNAKPRAQEWFNRFGKFLSQPNELVGEFDRQRIYRTFELSSETGYRKEFCDQLKSIYSRWRKSKQSRLQSERAAKRYPKKD